MINFYKPTAKNTGHACQFWFSKNEKSFFVELLKQHSWNQQTKTGSFKGSKSNPSKRTIIKLGIVEACEILETIDKNVKWSTYHTNEKNTTQIYFEPYIRDGQQVGFSFRVNKSSKQDTTQSGKASFLIGFKNAEARLLKEYLTAGLHQIITYVPPAPPTKSARSKTPKTTESSEEEVIF